MSGKKTIINKSLYFTISLAAMFVLFAAYCFWDDPTDLLRVTMLSVMALVFFVFSFRLAFILWCRNKEFQRLTAKNKIYHNPGNDLKACFGDSLGAIDEIDGFSSLHIANSIATKDWVFADCTGNGSVAISYGIMATDLPRQLPNVFFDSLKARGRQFRINFDPAQEHRLEGDFNKFFVTYFPKNYTIDSMSFISPEVMWALRSAAEYDIEIYGNRLFLYSSPKLNAKKQLDDMSDKLMEIKAKLSDNALIYRDERLPYSQGRQRVSVQGAELGKGNIFMHKKAIAIYIGLLFVAWLATR